MGVRELILVRHGESTANVAASAAEAARAELVDAPLRDADVPLTEVGTSQAVAVGVWLGDLPDDRFPTSVWCSPYLRAALTSELATSSQRALLGVRTDERLRDRELGILDTLTSIGVEARLPSEAARRRRLGKFYYRPPGGESWADVALRVRTLLADLDREEQDGRILLVTHDALIAVIRYVAERLSESEVLRITHNEPLLNASITRLVRPSGVGQWELETYNSVGHLQESGTPVTMHSGDPRAVPR
ncbi:MAG: Phosphoglycerate mutase [Cryobacterium sp.]|nr:Phosphoglycerate mutase [Cryobacterium sp.]